MMAVDTSALIAIIAGEADGEACWQSLDAERVVISAGTVAEALIVAGQKGLDQELNELLQTLNPEIAQVQARTARQMADAYRRWGKGVHPARLNLGDCFAYALAEEHGCPLLYIGNDFAQTDVVSALG